MEYKDWYKPERAILYYMPSFFLHTKSDLLSASKSPVNNLPPSFHTESDEVWVVDRGLKKYTYFWAYMVSQTVLSNVAEFMFVRGQILSELSLSNCHSFTIIDFAFLC